MYRQFTRFPTRDAIWTRGHLSCKFLHSDIRRVWHPHYSSWRWRTFPALLLEQKSILEPCFESGHHYYVRLRCHLNTTVGPSHLNGFNSQRCHCGLHLHNAHCLFAYLPPWQAVQHGFVVKRLITNMRTGQDLMYAVFYFLLAFSNFIAF